MKKQNVSSPHIHFYNPQLKQKASYLRKSMTKAEACLWKYALRAGGICGYKFKRQRPVSFYIADFMCIELKLIIEVDGLTHQNETVFNKDQIREKHLRVLGFEILRFSDKAILENIDGVKTILINWIISNNHLPLSPPRRGG
jgi:very-short-patch-repair endonuclease